MFEQEEGSDIPPLVYAEDLSSNGTYWNGTLIGRGNGGVLLSDGDVLRVSPRLSFSYRGADPILPEPRDEVLEREKKVDALTTATDPRANSSSCSSDSILSLSVRLELGALAMSTLRWTRLRVDSLLVR